MLFIPGILILSVFSLIILKSCEKDKYQHPVVHTGEVTDITPEGAMFHGRISVMGSEEIVDHGFVWDTKKNPVINNSYNHSMGALNFHKFSTFTTSVWEEGETYYMRAYVSDGLNVYYGREVSFVSLGGAAPIITKITPIEGTWGDTLTITGNYFSSKPDENIIHIHNYQSEKIHVSDSVIKTIIPAQLDTASSAVSISILGNITYAPERFHLHSPEIFDFNPKSGPHNERVVIDGKYFKPGSTKVFFGDKRAKVVDQSNSSATTLVPKDFAEGELIISIDVFNQRAIAEENFFYEKPIITDIFPKSVTWGENITIYGRYFGDNIDSTTVEIESQPAEIIYHSKDSIVAKIPDGALAKNPEVEVIVRSVRAKAENVISLRDMIINSFSPQSGTFWDIIDIYGEDFNPLKENNLVYLGHQQLIVIDANHDLLKVKIPSDNQVTHGQLHILCGDMEAASNDQFYMEAHIVDHFSPEEGTRLDQVKIYGQGFSPDNNTNKVFFGGEPAEIQYATNTEIWIKIPMGLEHGTHTIIVEILNHEVIIDEQFMLYEPYTRLNNPVFGGRARAITFEIDNRSFVGGGLGPQSEDDFYEYDPDSDNWIPKANIPVWTASGLSFSTTTKGYLLHGTFSDEMFVYNPQTDHWSIIPDYPYYNSISHKLFAIQDTGYVLNRVGNFTVNLWAFVEGSNQWYPLEPLPFMAAFGGIGFSINNKGYVALGRTADGQNRVWEYDPVSNSWSEMASFNGVMPGGTLQRLNATTAIANNKAYIFGGARDLSTELYYNDAYEFNPETNTIIRLPDIPGPKRRHAWAFSANGKVYIGGGHYLNENGNWIIHNDFWEFDPEKLPPANK